MASVVVDEEKSDDREDGGDVGDKFTALQSRCSELFDGVRQLPMFGRKAWAPFFNRCLQCHQELWDFQRENRAVLVSLCGLSRRTIGDIAYRIAQLCYQLYLRTSKSDYLERSYRFYKAILDRDYFSLRSLLLADSEQPSQGASKEADPGGPHGGVLGPVSPDDWRHAVKLLARCFVASLLMQEYQTCEHVALAGMTCLLKHAPQETDVSDWQARVDEATAFLRCERVVDPPPIDTAARAATTAKPLLPPLCRRLSARNCRRPGSARGLVLQSALVVDTNRNQVKFSELTLDMFRMLVTLEYEPKLVGQPGQGCENPRKDLLYSQSLSHVLLFLAAATKELPPNSFLLLYISAEGSGDGLWVTRDQGSSSPAPGAAAASQVSRRLFCVVGLLFGSGRCGVASGYHKRSSTKRCRVTAAAMQPYLDINSTAPPPLNKK
eukprot:m.325120 g.325120  ORF g.325120 m.325120 type:complete len:437 (+) comp19733_c2_seq8:462-1772(+)